MSIVTYDSYEATYYLMNGATLDSVSFRKVQPNKKRKLGVFTLKWKITLSGVNPELHKLWVLAQATVNLRDFEYQRKRLKERIEQVRKRPDFKIGR